MKNFSLVMPVYLRNDIIHYSLESVNKQTKKPYEIIIVDNNTNIYETKKLKSIIETFQNGVPIRYFKSLINSGAQARNLGVKYVTTEIVAFLDSDVILEEDYYEQLLTLFDSSPDCIAAQGLDIDLIKISNKNRNLFENLLYQFEQFFETSLLFEKTHPYVSPSLAISHPDVSNDFVLKSEWISTCAGMFKTSLFKKYSFPSNFITYSNNEYLMFSYSLFLNREGDMIYTSSAKYKDLQTSSGRIAHLPYLYQLQTYDTFIFCRLFSMNISNIFVFIKSRIGLLIYNILKSIYNRKINPFYLIKVIHSSIYPLLHLKEIIKGDLSFYDVDFSDF
ncbi:glycosyltransferase family 2 protein [Prochlorococcus marinus]|uniref:Glycosyltransferase 2-like domain-containing protein n=1 Tax=Prochlorococcus marinus XMU1408 TaxID=2213228 RepID=A0A318RGR0_PROMR|nr:glycosyltransferase family 2 protein [Prochlorococcus marinus]MBW3041835.1 hypothetical protein [Prochlorococcus marinus str. XMU1408]PYE02973.1 hypothetical protein DNJ73_04290 [Prochlorococcus marinus XMU1408]